MTTPVLTDFLEAAATGLPVRSTTPDAAAALAAYLVALETRNARLEAALRRFVASGAYCDTMQRGKAACGGACRWCAGRAALEAQSD